MQLCPFPRFFIVLAGLALGCQSGRVSSAPATAPAPASATFESRTLELIELLAPQESRAQAREQLIALGTAATPVLITQGRHPDFTVRWEVVNILGAISDPAATAFLSDKVVDDDNPHVRWRAMWALSQLPAQQSQIVELLSRHLKSEESGIAWNAAVGLSMFQSNAGLELLHAGVSDVDPWKRWEAINALGRVHDDGSIGFLEATLRSPSLRDRRETVLSLGMIGGPRAVGLLIEGLADDDPDVRWRAAMALGRAADERILPALQLVQEKDPDPTVRSHAEEAIQRIRERRARNPVVQ